MSKLINIHWGLRLAAVIFFGGLVLALVLISVRATGTQAAPAQVQVFAPEGPSAGPHTCNISGIAVYTTRIHVQCTTPAEGTIYYFAAPGDSANATTTNRWLALMNTAYSLGKPIYVYYHANTDNNPPGCLVSDCRGIDFLFIVP
ncbi:MAG: hypothetical protein PVG14_13280 [Anaerolineales bacterium]|jgi:hypothetical protein